MASTAHASTRAMVERKPMSAEAIAGIGGFIFLVTIIIQNVISLATLPANDASAAQILQFANDRAWVVDLFVVTFVCGYAALFLFAAGLVGRAERANRAARLWGRLGRSSVGVIAGFFGLVTITEVVLVAARGTLAHDANLTVVLWSLHNAIFTINLLAIGAALLGLSRAAALGGLIPRSLGIVTIVGALLLAIAAAPAVAEVHGSPLLALGLLGFLIWAAFIAVASIRLLRIGLMELDAPGASI
jgi:hypothetical protein